MEIIISKQLQFLQPFLIGLEKLVPIKNLTRIRVYKVAKNLNELSDASIIKHSKNRYSINLKVQYLYNKRYNYETIEKMLLDLAHELAHLKEWEHTPKHFKLEARIMLHFSEVLDRLNVMDHSKRVDKLSTKV